MGKIRTSVTNAELAVLEFLWDAGVASKKRIVTYVYPNSTESDRATVQKLLQRLESKGYVRRDRNSYTHTFAPVITRAAFAGEQLEHVAERFAGGSLSRLFMQLVESKKLGARERAKLRKILDEYDS